MSKPSRFKSVVVSGSQSIGTSADPDSKAVLDLVSTTKGFLPPRLTTTQRNAISSPTTGLLIYNTTTGFYDFYNGSSWQELAVSGSTFSPSEVAVDTGNGSGSTNTVIRRFSNVGTNIGSDITYADSAANGASFTINTDGYYAVSYSDEHSSTQSMGISRNSNQLTTGIASITTAHRMIMANMVSGNPAVAAVTLKCVNTDVIRPHNSTSLASSQPYNQFRIIRIG